MKSAVIALALAVGFVAFAERPAHAGIPLLITHGPDIERLRAVPADAAADLGMPDGALGYRYDAVGVFFLDIWRWGGEPVLYNGDEYLPLSAEDVASLGGADAPWDYRFPPGLIVLLAGAGLLLVLRLGGVRVRRG